ncbi:hypothetical protein RJ640_008714 [Escallonia rubra]|uniref:Uncharacterized protein n=1 Tax=Escallonia rubra TaxID=112253 RepID=A0AA88UI98_9ASTE|nr:hypothetical protein RJ640_008714 [Escallonia rubra]
MAYLSKMVGGRDLLPAVEEAERRLNVLMESKGGKKKYSSSKSFYEAPLGYSIEDVRPHGRIKKFRSAAYSNCSTLTFFRSPVSLYTPIRLSSRLTGPQNCFYKAQSSSAAVMTEDSGITRILPDSEICD